MATHTVPIIASILLGIFTMMYLNELNPHLKAYFKALTDVCFTDLSQPIDSRPSFFRFHVPGLDHFNCVLTRFFKDALKTPEGLLVTRELLGLFLVVVGFTAVESIRPGARGFVGWYPAVTGLSQLLGVSVIFPWAWLSSYWWANQHKFYSYINNRTPSTRSRFAPPDPKSPRTPEPNPIKICGVIFAVLAIVLPVNILMCLPLPQEKWVEVVLAVNTPIVPLVGVVWMLLPKGTEVTVAGVGHKRARMLWFALAASGYGFHLWGLFTLLEPGFPPANLLPIVWGQSQGVAAAHFLFIDFSVLFLAISWFVASEPLQKSLFSFFLLSVLVGPGAALGLFLVRREKMLASVAGLKRE